MKSRRFIFNHLVVGAGEQLDVPTQAIDASATGHYLDDSQAKMEVNFPNRVRFRFAFAELAAKLANDPKFTIFCPIPATAMRLRASTPDAWWPQAARGDIEKDLPNFAFDLDLVRKPVNIGSMQLRGNLRRNATGVGGEFVLLNYNSERRPTQARPRANDLPPDPLTGLFMFLQRIFFWPVSTPKH